MSGAVIILLSLAVLALSIAWWREIALHRQLREEVDALSSKHKHAGHDLDVMRRLEANVRESRDKLLMQSSAVTARLCESETAAAQLATCVQAYVDSFDEISKQRGEEPCALTRERAALSAYEKLKPSPCSTNPT